MKKAKNKKINHLSKKNKTLKNVRSDQDCFTFDIIYLPLIKEKVFK